MSKLTPLQTALAYLAFALLFRFFSFFPTLIDHDESTYLVIANEILNGKQYWLDIFDTKPIGIFLLYAGFIKVAGNSIFLLRLLTALWIGLTAWLIYDIQRRWIPKGHAPWLGGMFYLAMISLFTFYGVSPNTEIYFSSLAILAIWLNIRCPWQWGSMILAGLAIGCGLMIKQAVLFDAVALGLFLLWKIRRDQRDNLRRITQLGVMTLISFVPLALVMLWYFRAGALDVFVDHQFFLPGRYLDNELRSFPWQMIPDFFLRYFLITTLAVVALVRLPFRSFPMIGFYLIWLVLACLGAMLPKNAFGHYFIALIPQLAMLASLLWHPDIRLPGWMSWLHRPRIGYLLLGLFILTNGILQYKDYFSKPDPCRSAFHVVKASGIQDPVIFTGTSNYQALYFLLDVHPPVAYPHPSLLFDDRFRTVMEIDSVKEFNQVTAAEPDFCFFNLVTPRGDYAAWLDMHYSPLDTLDKVVVFQRNREE